jgi:RNA polymerase sigma factor (TIGR02999 family)
MPEQTGIKDAGDHPAALGTQRQALDELFSAAYEELRRMAIAAKRSRVNPAVSTGTLIHAAWLKLAGAQRFAPESREHFMRIAARTMRFVLTEAARKTIALKRGGENAAFFVTMDADGFEISSDKDVLALDDALGELERLSPRQARIVEERFYGGFPEQEIAAMLEISTETVRRDWRSAKAWLAVALRRHG